MQEVHRICTSGSPPSSYEHVIAASVNTLHRDNDGIASSVLFGNVDQLMIMCGTGGGPEFSCSLLLNNGEKFRVSLFMEKKNISKLLMG